jgi:YD repeat-containing protein
MYNSTTTNTLASKTDAKSQVLTYAYDNYNRLTSVSSGGSALRTYYYDTNPLDTTGFSKNIAERLAAVKYPATPTGQAVQMQAVQMNDMYSYVAAGTSGAGLAATKRLQLNQVLSGKTVTLNLDAAYTYNGEGAMTSVAYPNSGPSYNYSYDGM